MLNQACGSFRVKINLSNKLLLARGSRGLGVVCDWGWHIYILLIIILSCSSQSHPTLCVLLDCSLLNSVHEIFQARNTGLDCHFLLQAIFLTHGLNLCLLCLLHCRQILYLLGHWGSHTLLLSNYYKLLTNLIIFT